MAANDTINSTAAPEAEYEEPIPEDPFAEPVPDFEKALEVWGPWWYVHVYGSGVLFIILVIFALRNVMYLAWKSSSTHKAYFIALNCIVMVFATERSIFMLVDAYNKNDVFGNMVSFLLLSIGLPCITSSFYLTFVAWMKVTRMQRIYVVHKPRTMAIVIVLHFGLSLLFTLLAEYVTNQSSLCLMLVCQALFVLLGISLSLMYVFLYVRIYFATVKTRSSLIRMSTSRTPGSNHARVHYDTDNSNPVSSNQENLTTVIPETKIPDSAKLILATAVALFIMACLYLIEIYYTAQVIKGEGETEPWSWWSYKFATRLCEVAFCWTISLAATRPITINITKHSSVLVRTLRRKFTSGINRNSSSQRETNKNLDNCSQV